MIIYALPSVFIKKYKDEMLIVNTQFHSVFIVNDIASDIIQYIYNKRKLRTEEIENLNENINHETMCAFIQELVECGIVGCSAKIQEQYDDVQEKVNDMDYDEDLEADFQSKFINDNKLYAAIIELTYRCNLKCSHCYAVTNNNYYYELSTKQVFDLLDQLSDNGVFRVTFTGGEIFVREDILSIINYAYKKGFLIDIFSNATLLNEQKIRSLASCYIRSFQVSLYSYKPDVHDSITGIKGSFARTMNMLKLLKKYGISINIKSVMMKENSGDYKGIERLAKELGASFQTSLYIIPHNNGCKNNLDCRIQETDIIKKILRYDLNKINARSFYRSRSKSDYICNIGKSGISINPYGDLFPCNLLKIKLGNCTNEKISDIWNKSTTVQKLRDLKVSDIKECSCCENLNYCFFCPGAALAETGDMLSPYDEACSIAKIKKELDYN